jgi:hypothetical protein
MSTISVCKHLGFILEGVFRIYRADESTGEEKNMLFFFKWSIRSILHKLLKPGAATTILLQ